MAKANNWKISDYIINGYMADNQERMKQYQSYDGFKWIKFVVKMAEENGTDKDVEKYYNALKNYSLLREYWRMGLKDRASAIVKWAGFKDMKPRDILMQMNRQVNKVYVTLANSEEVTELVDGCTEYQEDRLQTPEQGYPFVFPLMTQIFQGIRLGQFMAWGMLSNAGKSRFLIRLIINLAFVYNKKILIISNEMTKEEMKACLITTAINNPDIQALSGEKVTLKQNDLQNGVYEADEEFIGEEGVVDGKIVHIVNKDGENMETAEEYKERVYRMSSQYRKTNNIVKWMDKKMRGRIYIVETGSEYSDNDLKQIIENTCLSEGIEYVFYDTFKSDKDAMGDWAAMKKTATILSEIAKTKNLFIGANIQLTDDANNVEPIELTSNNIANSKQIKHVLDSLCLFREIHPSTYDKYRYWTSLKDNPIDKELQILSLDQRYYLCKIDKNRAGSKPNLLFSLNLDTNIWTEVGRVDLLSNLRAGRSKSIKK